jgi:hypothetical protein
MKREIAGSRNSGPEKATTEWIFSGAPNDVKIYE